MARTVGEALLPIQYAIGISGGCEVVVHTVTNWVHHILQDEGENVILKLDLKNAFNSISRRAIRRGVLTYAPQLLRYYDWIYGAHTSIFLKDGSEIAKSECGVRQGDPLGPLLFSLGLQVVLAEATELCLPVDVYALMDDITIHGRAADVATYLEFLQDWVTDLPKIGLLINVNKSEILCSQTTAGYIKEKFSTHAILFLHEGFEILGCPAGKDNYVEDILKEKFKSYKKSLDILGNVRTSVAFPVLRSCVNTKPGYIARTCLPWLTKRHNELFDKQVNDTIAHMIQKNTIDSVSVAVRHLPEKMGGLGIPCIAVIAPLAWAASYGYALKFTQLEGQEIGWDKTINSGGRELTRIRDELSKHYENFSFGNQSFTPKKQKEMKNVLD